MSREILEELVESTLLLVPVLVDRLREEWNPEDRHLLAEIVHLAHHLSHQEETADHPEYWSPE